MNDVSDAHHTLLQTSDESRQRLIRDPKAELARVFGAPMPDGDYRAEIVEQLPNTITIIVPVAPSPEDGADSRLHAVAGRVFDAF